jgi:hypothetical protein
MTQNGSSTTDINVDSVLLNIIGMAVGHHFDENVDPWRSLDNIAEYAEDVRTRLRGEA